MRSLNYGASLSSNTKNIITDHADLFEDQVNIEENSSDHRLFIPTKQKDVFFCPSLETDQIIFDAKSGTSDSLFFGIPELLEQIMLRGADGGRFVFALAEKRQGESIGHMLAAYCDKRDGLLAIHILDSKPEGNIALKALAYFSGYTKTHCDAILASQVKERIGEKFSIDRFHYGHQASMLNNWCPLFSKDAIATILAAPRSSTISEILETIGVYQPPLGLRLFSSKSDASAKHYMMVAKLPKISTSPADEGFIDVQLEDSGPQAGVAGETESTHSELEFDFPSSEEEDSGPESPPSHTS